MSKFEKIQYQENEPDLLQSQRSLHKLCEQIVDVRPSMHIASKIDIESLIPASVARDVLAKSSLQDILLSNGESLSSKELGPYFPNLHIYATKDALQSVLLNAWKWEYPKVRKNPSRIKDIPSNVISYPTEKDWANQLDIAFTYSNGFDTAKETISLTTSSPDAGNMPYISRIISAPAYNESYNEGHNFIGRSCATTEEASVFLDLFRTIYTYQINKQC
ncbi:MAG: hypothetical protein NVSMB46_01700 [Candidatus Saccharimonadales bacterium]